jgi:hypothetical protein
MTSAGLFFATIITWFEIILFACLRKSLVAGVFYLARPDYSAQFLSEKISEGE